MINRPTRPAGTRNNPAVPDPILFTCCKCGHTEPRRSIQHECILNLGAEGRRRADEQRRENAQRAAAELVAVRCEDCGKTARPGVSHFCRLQPDPSLPNPVAEIVAELAKAGYKVERA
jgi:hypothetical protein